MPVDDPDAEVADLDLELPLELELRLGLGRGGYQLEIACAEGREIGLVFQPLVGLGVADVPGANDLVDLLGVFLAVKWISYDYFHELLGDLVGSGGGVDISAEEDQLAG